LQQFQDASFDYVIFNFPHTGVPQHSTENGRQVMEESIASNRAMIYATCLAVKRVMREKARFVITLKNVMPYTAWGMPALAGIAGLQLIRSYPFDGEFWASQGYRHATTIKNGSKVAVDAGITYEFCRPV
jgi:hypothetical protein